MKRWCMLLAAPLLCLGLIAGPAFARAGSQAAVNAGQQRVLSPRIPNPAAYAKAKAMAAAYVARHHGGAAPTAGPLDPVVNVQWDGQFQGNLTPPDPTGAVGPNSFIQLVNSRYGIYDRSGTLINSGTLTQLTGGSGSLGDVQILWDTRDQKFYYVVDNFTTNHLLWGVSKNDNPQSAADWCKYDADFGYGSALPDYPKLGNTPAFIVIGVNVFNPNFVGSDVDWIYKGNIGPNPIQTCPAQGLKGRIQTIKNADNTLATTPVPGVMTDNDFATQGRGAVVAEPDNTVNTYITLYQLIETLTGLKMGPPMTIPVPSYSAPANAAQCQAGPPLDTLDGRLETAVTGSDPLRGGFAIWTSHAVLGGAGSEQRWYEINANFGTLMQSGVVTSPTLFVWNGGISNDRTVNPSGKAHGENMVLGVNTSNATNCPAIQMVSKVGNNPQSGMVLVKQSPGKNQDFSCGICRWGDYSGAKPDPAAPLTDPTGKVWLSNEWNVASTDPSGTDWRTEVWEATP
jgi:hypothetical protein